MSVFLIVPLSSNLDQLETAAKNAFGGESVLSLQHRAGLLVSASGTTVEISHKLGITSPAQNAADTLVGPAMVSLVTTYYGRGSSNMWEWIKSRVERGS